ncbi:MAG TPA: hypothetical protein P5572_09755 [Phycisphaerae bacterium]|nr:hypothetical protein [Phycisphaerae bacterium]
MEEYLAARAGARRSELLIVAGSIVLAVALIAGAAMLVPTLNDIRKRAQITLDPATVKSLPPDVALMTKLGTLRALAIDVAFQRMEELKQENRFYELMQLSDWLCKLAPRYPSVWSYAAWNMAYNISVCQYTPEARWLWVENGIKCLRDQGIPYNPRSVTLYKELAWIYFHKIGDKLDDEHRAYKTELAVDMQIVFGDPPVGKTPRETVEAFRTIVEAPRNWQVPEELLALRPQWQALYADLQSVDLHLDKAFLRFLAIESARASRPDIRVAAAVEEEPTPQEKLRAQRLAVINNGKYAAELPELVAAVRSHVIRTELHMDLDWMLKLMEDPPWVTDEVRAEWHERYGPDADLCPVDWRTAWAQTLYWGTYGDHVTLGKININAADSMNTVRLIFFALESMARSGIWIIEPNYEHPNHSFYQALPDNRFIKHMQQAYLYYGKLQFGTDPRFVEGTSGPNYFGGQRNFLIDSIQQLYLAGGKENLEEAKDYFFYLKKYDRELDAKHSVKRKYLGTFEDFVFDGMLEDLDTEVRAQMFIAELLHRSLKDAGNGDAEASVRHFNEAKRWWNYYMRDKKDLDRNSRRKLQPIGIIRRDVAFQYMVTPTNSPRQKWLVWQALDLPTRQSIYDKVHDAVAEQCSRYEPPYDPDKVLPEPPGMEEARANDDKVFDELKVYDPTVHQGEKINPE